MRTTLTVDIDYDPDVTDPETLASATDRLLETALSTPGIMDEYANPRFGEFFVMGSRQYAVYYLATNELMTETYGRFTRRDVAQQCVDEADSRIADDLIIVSILGIPDTANCDEPDDGRDEPIDDLLAKAEAAGLETADLDEIVHELTSSIAADVNNEGMAGQLRYLIDQMGVQGVTQQLDRLAKELSKAETTESTAMNDSKHDYELRIDGPLLAKQRRWLLDLADKTTGHGREHLEGVVALLDEIADQAHDRYGIDCLLKPDADEPKDSRPDDDCRCHCELQGHFNSGIPGILAHLENGHLPEGAKVERCDLVAATHWTRWP